MWPMGWNFFLSAELLNKFKVQLKTGDREQLQPIPLKKEQEEVKTVIQNQDTQKPASD